MPIDLHLIRGDVVFDGLRKRGGSVPVLDGVEVTVLGEPVAVAIVTRGGGAVPCNTQLTTEVTMSPFTDKEIEYLRGQRLGRMATTGSNGAPHIVPVGFHLDSEAETIQIGGHGLSKSKKWRDLQANPKIAFVVDDLASVHPWTPRGIEVRGTAELHREGGEQRFGGGGWDSAWFAVVPQRIISWGIEGPAFSAAGRSARSVA